MIYIDSIHFFITEIMAARVREEIRRLHRRKQLHFNPNHDSNSNDSTDCVTDAPGSPSSSFATAQATSHPDKPLFTLSQVLSSVFYTFLCVLI